MNTSQLERGYRTIELQVDLFEEDFVSLDKDSEADQYAEQLIRVSSDQGEYTEDTRLTIIRELTMGDKYTTGQAGAVGPDSNSSGNTFNQIWQQTSGDIDLPTLASELDQLRNSMKSNETTAEEDAAIGAVAAAQAAAENGDGPGALSHLKTAGNWALDAATKLGSTLRRPPSNRHLECNCRLLDLSP